jgi:N-acetylneuraminic acid mutarotase
MRLLVVGTLASAIVAVAAALGTRPGDVAQARASQWRYAASMSQRRSYVAGASAAGRIYAAGGMVGDSGRRLATVQRYDPARDSWTSLSPLPEPVRAAAGATLGGKIYVVGGDDADGDGTDVYAYDIAAGTWSARAPLPAPRINHAAVALDGKLYVLGGYADGTEHADVFVYDPKMDSWSRAVPLPEPEHAFGAVAFHGQIWVIGGRRGERILRSVWVFDPAADRWRAGPTMPKPMELVGAAVADDQVHAIWERTYQIYDARSHSWSDGPPTLTTRHGLEAFFVDGSLYAIGGCTTALRDSQVVEKRPLRAGSRSSAAR